VKVAIIFRGLPWFGRRHAKLRILFRVLAMNVACVERPVHWTRCESLTQRTRYKGAREPFEVLYEQLRIE
jgi:hypothetical protein